MTLANVLFFPAEKKSIASLRALQVRSGWTGGAESVGFPLVKNGACQACAPFLPIVSPALQ
jgi:hypothetical protein